MIQLPLFIAVAGFFTIISLIFYFILRSRITTRENLIYGYILGILIMFLSYFDTWNHHLLIVLPILIIIIFNLSRTSDIIKRYIKISFFFFNFIDITFTILFFFTVDFFPFNFVGTVFLLIILYGILKFCYNGDSQGKGGFKS